MYWESLSGRGTACLISVFFVRSQLTHGAATPYSVIAPPASVVFTTDNKYFIDEAFNAEWSDSHPRASKAFKLNSPQMRPESFGVHDAAAVRPLRKRIGPSDTKTSRRAVTPSTFGLRVSSTIRPALPPAERDYWL